MHASRDRLHSIHVEHLKELIRENNLADDFDNEQKESVKKISNAEMKNILGSEIEDYRNRSFKTDEYFFVRIMSVCIIC